ncbi:hypothetical protein [Streptomyces albiflavescens]|nr:hypothetical protein [Streptomyces albiflavescens]
MCDTSHHRSSRISRAQPLCRRSSVVTAHLDEDMIRIFHGPELVTTVPRVTSKEVVVRKSGEHNRRKIV